MGDHDQQVFWLAAYGPCITFPDFVNPVVFEAGHTAYSCGGSPGFEPEFPLNPREGNLSCVLTVPQRRRRVNSIASRLTVMAFAGTLTRVQESVGLSANG